MKLKILLIIWVFLATGFISAPLLVHAEDGDAMELAVEEERPVPFYKPEELQEKIKKASEENDPVAQYTIGAMLYYGKLVAQDKFKAEKYITMAANAGYAEAQTQMAYIHIDKSSHTLALEWLYKAAAQKEPWACFKLAQYYEEGVHVFKSYDKAREYYEIAADAGIMNAVLKLGTYYQYGIGVEKDNKSAIAYYEFASEKGNDDFRLHVSLLLTKLFVELGNNPEEQQGESKEQIFKWQLRAAELGHLDSIVATAQAYFEGIGTTVDYVKAIEWYKKATEYGHLVSMVKLGQIYANGLGTSINFEEAAKWYRRAAENGNAEAAWNLANLYENGLGVEKNDAEAEKWHFRAQQLGHKPKWD